MIYFPFFQVGLGEKAAGKNGAEMFFKEVRLRRSRPYDRDSTRFERKSVLDAAKQEMKNLLIQDLLDNANTTIKSMLHSLWVFS